MSLFVSLLLCVLGPVIVVGPGSGVSSARALLLPIEVGYAQARQVPVVAVREVIEPVAAAPGGGAAAGPKQLLGAMEAAYASVNVRGRNDGQMRAHPGSFPDVTVSLKPGSGLAMRGNRHPITEASLGDVLALMVRDLKRSEARPQDGVTLTDLGEETRFGARVRCVEGRFPAEGYYAPRLRICVFVASKLLSRVQAWDAGDRLVEDYEYRDLRVNVGLRDRDFAEDNPAYDF